uniref:Thiamin biosynthesis protein S n=1 Tax=Erythroglossum lusitanicum TaxID=2575615 RepID=A0A4D6WVG8_9FLOR|nr:Thiamin biosynthesis protein S [Erythroglossum lusitanicum]
MKNYLTIFINGDPFNCDYSMSLRDILLYLNFNINSVIIEYNKEIVTSSRFEDILLKTNDSLEVITIVGGG